MPNAIEMRFALGQIAYHSMGSGMITRVKVTAWHAAQRGRGVTYTVKTKAELVDDVPDADLFHTLKGAEASYQESCQSHIAYHQHQINMWSESLSLDCQLTDTSLEDDDNGHEKRSG